MKTNLLLAGTLVIVAAVSTATAVEPPHSPKGKAFADSLRKVAAVHSDVDLIKGRPLGNLKAWELAPSFRIVTSTGSSVDLAHGSRPLRAKNTAIANWINSPTSWRKRCWRPGARR